jgi:hypothetical protein
MWTVPEHALHHAQRYVRRTRRSAPATTATAGVLYDDEACSPRHRTQRIEGTIRFNKEEGANEEIRMGGGKK